MATEAKFIEHLKVHRLDVVDHSGRLRMFVGYTDSNAWGVTLYDATQNPRLELTVDYGEHPADGASIQLFDAKGGPVAWVSVDAAGEVSVRRLDPTSP